MKYDGPVANAYWMGAMAWKNLGPSGRGNGTKTPTCSAHFQFHAADDRGLKPTQVLGLYFSPNRPNRRLKSTRLLIETQPLVPHLRQGPVTLVASSPGDTDG